MEELQKTQEYAAERRKAGAQDPAVNPGSSELPVSGEDGTRR